MGVGQPVVHRRPADLRGKAGEQQQVGRHRGRPSRAERGQLLPGEPAGATWQPGGEDRDAEQRHAQTQRSQDQVFPARLQRVPRPPEPASPGRAPGRGAPPPPSQPPTFASERGPRPRKPPSTAEAAVVASTSSQAAPRFPASGTASSTAQKTSRTAQEDRKGGV